AGFLRVGGRLLVSDTPVPDPDRWPTPGLRSLGFGPVRRISGIRSTLVEAAVLESCPERIPRRNGVPAKRPLW
ncbi:MAG: 16S rRNA (guanine(527)-N(7))-methyltransferase RsmG, partial [Actinomycetes bacterium]